MSKIAKKYNIYVKIKKITIYMSKIAKKYYYICQKQQKNTKYMSKIAKKYTIYVKNS